MAQGSGFEDGFSAEQEGQERDTSVGRADAVVIAIAMDQGRHDRELSRNASDYLARLRQLVDLQIKHFDQQHRLSIAAAKRTRYADRMRNGLGTFLALVRQ